MGVAHRRSAPLTDRLDRGDGEDGDQEALNALMAVPNLIALLLLQKRVIRQTKRYFQRRKDGA